jgi:hypothetical protein
MLKHFPTSHFFIQIYADQSRKFSGAHSLFALPIPIEHKPTLHEKAKEPFLPTH